MIKLSGALSIRTINGRNGPFNVGRLVTEEGEFSVKDKMLDQYEEGKYEGEFGVSRIYPTHYIAGTRFIIEVRAVLESVALVGIDELDEDPALLITEPDPVEEAKPSPQPEGSSEPEVKSDGDIDDASLFGTLWPLGERVKLDTTVERSVLRQQISRMGKLGYKLQAVGQVWVKEDTNQQDAA